MSMTPIKYSGRKPYRDRTALRMEWQPGDIKRVPENVASALLRYAEFARVEQTLPETTAVPELDAQIDNEVEAAIVAQTQREQEQRNELAGMMNVIDTMDKDALETYAAKYEVNLDKRRGLDKLRAEVANLIEQFGVR